MYSHWQTLETIPVPINIIMNEKNVVYLYDQMLYSDEKEQTTAIHNEDEHHKQNFKEARNTGK